MFYPKHILTQNFIWSLQATYRDLFEDCQVHYLESLNSIGQKILETLANSDALYHDLEHTILVASVGQEILRAKQAYDGLTAVSPEDWLNFMTALLCHDIGYLKGACYQDNHDIHRYTTGINGHFITLTAGSTDAALAPYHVDRSKQFVTEQFAHKPLINLGRVREIIEFTRFPIPQDMFYQKTHTYAGLARAADLIGQLGDRHYLQKLPGLFYEFEETEANQQLGYQTSADIRKGLPDFYRNIVHPYIKDAIVYLNCTQPGRQIIADLYANIFTVKKGFRRKSMTPYTSSRMTLVNTPNIRSFIAR